MEFDVVILSGGKSMRMGKDKGSLSFFGETFVDTQIRKLSGAANIMLSTGDIDIYDAKVTHIHDEYKNCGPMGGIHKALKEAQSEWVFAVACDMPLIDLAFAKSLLARGLSLKPQAKVILPMERSGRLHLLGGFYHKSLVGVFEAMLQAKDYKMRNILARAESIVVSVDNRESAKLENINTATDYERILSKQVEENKVISFVGLSNSGKTTLIEKIIKKLTEDGYRVAYFKHTHHELTMSGKNKDNERMFEAGALVSTTISDQGSQSYDNRKSDIFEHLEGLEEADIILIEGYKNLPFQRILVTTDADDSKWPIPRECVWKVVGSDKEMDVDFHREAVDEICKCITSGI